MKKRFGEEVGASKLTNNQVALIRRIWPHLVEGDHVTLGEIFGITPQHLRKVGAGKLWKHI